MRHRVERPQARSVQLGTNYTRVFPDVTGVVSQLE